MLLVLRVVMALWFGFLALCVLGAIMRGERRRGRIERLRDRMDWEENRGR